MQSLRLDERVTATNFDEVRYLAANPDVAAAVAAGHLLTGRQHYAHFGHREPRRMRVTSGLDALRQAKMARLLPFLRLDLPHVRRGAKIDFLTPELRQQAAVVPTDNVSANPYPDPVRAMIARHPDGLLLDCGAGQRDVYYDTIVNYEIVDYDSTDVLGIGETLPFQDGSFDGVISVAVLEHVRDPFACAAELVRVLKPGGEIACEVPFLQPLHGFPHHYYNMTPQGLRALFEGAIDVDNVFVLPSGSPVWSLTWVIRRWAECLDEPVRREFLGTTLGDLLRPADDFMGRPWVKSLSAEANLELAAATFLTGRKPAAPEHGPLVVGKRQG